MKPEVKNPKCINCNKSDSNYFKFKEGIGDFEEIGTWGFKHLYKSSGYWNTNNQYTVGLAIPRDCKDLDTIELEIKTIMPHLKPVKEGLKMIRILEHTSSIDVTFEIGCDDKDVYYLVQHVQGEMTKVEQESLMKLLEFIREFHYSPYDEDEGDE